MMFRLALCAGTLCLSSTAMPAHAASGNVDIYGTVRMSLEHYGPQRHFPPALLEVNDGNPGLEMVLPNVLEMQGAYAVKFDVLAPDMPATNGSTYLYSSAEKSLAKPACPEGSAKVEEADVWAFTRHGSYMVAGAALAMQCDDGHVYYKTHVYIVDVSAPDNPVAHLAYGERLVGLQLVSNLNKAGSAMDLMLTTVGTGGETVVRIRDFHSGIYSRNQVLMD